MILILLFVRISFCKSKVNFLHRNTTHWPGQVLNSDLSTSVQRDIYWPMHLPHIFLGDYEYLLNYLEKLVLWFYKLYFYALSGWQPRWFVLEVGVLAYYKSQEEVGLGSRGSVKMACCEISGKSLTYKLLRYIEVHKATRWTIRDGLMLLWFKDLLLSYSH